MLLNISSLIALLFQAANVAPPPPKPLNAGFEQIAETGAPANWTFFETTPNPSYRFETALGVSGRGGRLHASAANSDPNDGATVSQIIDASPWRGKRVRFRARLKVDRPGFFVGLGLNVVRPQPKSAGFNDMMLDRPIGAGGWSEHILVGRVAPDALTVKISINVSGEADVSIDDVRIDALPPDPRPASKEAQDYLMAAIALIRTNYIDGGSADWNRIVANARADIGGARTPRDTYSAIRGVLGALGEKHSAFYPAPPSPPAGAAPPPPPGPTGPVVGQSTKRPPPPLPSWRLAKGRFGLLTLPGLMTLGSDGPAQGEAYTGALRSGLQAMDGPALCGWIIDLRDNGGGNMWPMLKGLDPLLGTAPFGSFVDGAGEVQPWQRRNGGIVPAAGPPGTQLPAFRLKNEFAPVALLIGPRTASSGEMVAIAFTGRGRVRSFGQASAGYTTANGAFPLTDGAVLAITGAFVRDRTGKDYRNSIEPDVTTGEDTEVEAAKWLATACARPVAP